MNFKRQLRWTLIAVLLSCLATGSVIAQDQESLGMPTPGQGSQNPGTPGNPSNDPPARVARIQYISGQVSMQSGGNNDWVAANLNLPLTTSDRVWADKDSRAELNVGTAFVRLNSETSLTLTNVADNSVQLQLDQGTLELTVQHLEPGEIFEINTPNLAFTVMKSGVYRIDVPPNDNQTWVTVRKGSGEATGQGPAVKVKDGEQVRFSGQGTLENTAYAAPAPDGFDDWAQVRDKRLDGSQSARYVAPGVIGYQDLDYYGTWRTVPNYGAIWVPSSVPVGWAPYRYGHWVWVNPWGWTWVDDAPWGFAPFHYGRWVNYGGAWGWAPGPLYVGWRPYYAPALVAWVGGAGWGVGVSFGFGWGGGGCGWFALGWGEPYYPWYHGYRGGYVSNTYIRNVNVTNTHITNITNVTNNYYRNVNNTNYVNRNVPGAVSAAPKSALINGQNIARVGTAVPRSELAKGQIQRGADVTLTRQSELGGRTPLTAGVPPGNVNNHPATASSTPGNHNVPQAPASSIAHNPNTEVATQTHTVPRPPEHAAATSASASSAYPGQAGAQHTVPKPPYAGTPAPASTATGQHVYPSAAPRTYTPPPAHQSGQSQAAPPANHGGQSGRGTQESKPKESGKSNPGMAYSNVPRPPAGYGYHAAPSYGASTYAGGSSYSGASASRSATPAYTRTAPTYGGSSYTPPSYHSGGYGSAPTYSAHANAAPSPHYSAPSYSSGSGGHYSGGGSSHASSSGGHSR